MKESLEIGEGSVQAITMTGGPLLFLYEILLKVFIPSSSSSSDKKQARYKSSAPDPQNRADPRFLRPRVRPDASTSGRTRQMRPRLYNAGFSRILDALWTHFGRTEINVSKMFKCIQNPSESSKDFQKTSSPQIEWGDLGLMWGRVSNFCYWYSTLAYSEESFINWS
ncbi:hypothetical protein K435DRAFT_803423 [Dendrothele bispora CBS 962.96]|uniref:Uncharacterized protein n=1 Tax=Dendrothele bispora (strain CBS 962.96) TaxID=1314807 RepID=A0A4S8LI56_DENBC|nr:hypothetical protein K435DRAFT_803423 [Dendrothele bispora CBS 962.96]